MLHAVPELLDSLEARLMAGEDPAPLLAGIRWSELVAWPVDADGALALKRRITSLQNLLTGLQSPLRAATQCLSGAVSYGRHGGPAEVPLPAARLRGRA